MYVIKSGIRFNLYWAWTVSPVNPITSIVCLRLIVYTFILRSFVVSDFAYDGSKYVPILLLYIHSLITLELKKQKKNQPAVK